MGDAIAARTAAQPVLSGRALRILKDERLAAMVTAGSDDAFSTLYGRYHQSIYRYSFSLLHQEADARDALQSTMLSALASLRARPIEGALKPWLFRIAHNQSISIIRGRAREAPTEAPSTPAVSDDPETREQLRTLVADLGALPDRQRGAIVMRELSGLSYTEIGAVLGTSEAAGKQLVYEARTALQDLRAGHDMSCEAVREQISAHDRRVLRGRKIRSHLRGCQPCQDFEQAIRPRRTGFALLAPPLTPIVAAAILQEVFAGGGAGAGGAGAGTAAGASGAASGGSAASVVAPVALKVTAAVLLAGAAGVGAYEAGKAVLGSSTASAPAAVTQADHTAARAGSHAANRGADHAARPAARHHDAAAKARPSDKGGATPGGNDPAASSQSSQVADPAAPGTSSAPTPAGTSDAAGTPSGDPSGTGGSGGGGGGDTGAGVTTSGGATGGGDTGGGDPAPPEPEPAPKPPPPPPAPAPAGVPPGHGGVPPGLGGDPPGLVAGDTPPGLLNNPGHGHH
jgi:RNA polymerase sigma factor (sigma-70 family)